MRGVCAQCSGPPPSEVYSLIKWISGLQRLHLNMCSFPHEWKLSFAGVTLVSNDSLILSSLGCSIIVIWCLVFLFVFFFLPYKKHQNRNIQTMSAPWRTISPEALEDLHLSSQTLVFFIFEETFYCLRLSIKRISVTSASWNDWQTPQTCGCTPVKLLWGAARCCRDGLCHTYLCSL